MTHKEKILRMFDSPDESIHYLALTLAKNHNISLEDIVSYKLNTMRGWTKSKDIVGGRTGETINSHLLGIEFTYGVANEWLWPNNGNLAATIELTMTYNFYPEVKSKALIYRRWGDTESCTFNSKLLFNYIRRHVENN